MVEVEGFKGVVGPDPVAGRFSAEFCSFGGFVRRLAALLIGEGDEGVVILTGNDEEFGHDGWIRVRWRG